MTDGILLAEIPFDQQLRSYDTIIIDEARPHPLRYPWAHPRPPGYP